jgi:hypothetical protein
LVTVVIGIIVALTLVSSYRFLDSISTTTHESFTISQYDPMTFTGFCEPCSYDNVYSYSISQLEQDVMMLKNLGVTQIRVDLGFDPWLSSNETAIQKDVSIINFIKSQGLSLVIADASAERYRSYPQSWSAFKQEWAFRVRTLATLFQPSYYLVIKEPGWYVPMVSDSRANPEFRSASDWLNLTNWLASEVLSVSPKTLLGVSVCSNCIYKSASFYVPLLTRLPNSMSFVAFDTYGPADDTAMHDFLSNNSLGARFVWNAEAWSQASSTSNASTDPNWLASQYQFDVSNRVSEMMPFYSNDFVTYSTSSPATFVASTPIAREFQDLTSKG